MVESGGLFDARQVGTTTGRGLWLGRVIWHRGIRQGYQLLLRLGIRPLRFDIKSHALPVLACVYRGDRIDWHLYRKYCSAKTGLELNFLVTQLQLASRP